MAEVSTATLHERADAAAGQGDFATALLNAAEALRAAPQDPKARVKVAICFSMLQDGQTALDALRVVAIVLARRGYMLSAIGACRDALGIKPGDPNIRQILHGIHAKIHGKVGRGRPRVPPPAPPASVDPESPDSLLKIKDRDAMIAAAKRIATTDPTAGQEDVEPGFVPFFSDLSEETFVELVEKMRYHKVGPGHEVVKQDDEDASLFVLLSGEVTVSQTKEGETHELARLGSGSLFGEMSLITAKPRTATVRTTQAAELFEIDRATVEDIATRHAAISEEIVKFARRRLLMNVMATSKIFAPFEDKQRFEVLRQFKSRVVEAGTTIIEEGQDAHALYVVLEGEVEVSKIDDAGDAVVLAYLKTGDVFGEVSLILEDKTIAKVTAAEKSVVLVLEKEKFDAVTKAHPKILDYLSNLSGERLDETEEAMSADGVIIDADELIIL
ncbi:MAG: cyclic nucleotide-binding domain-containing protein [Deltaproteobacteria bacterium]